MTNSSVRSTVQHEADAAGLAFIEHEEGLITHVYKDQAGKPTIGMGHLITKLEQARGTIIIGNEQVEFRKGLTKAQCLKLLDQDLDNAERAVNTYVQVPLTQNQFDALVSFTFNCGAEALHGSTLLRKLNAGNYAAVPGELARWNHADGKVCPVLTARRAREGALWSK